MLTRVQSNQLSVEQFRVNLRRVCGAFDARPVEDKEILKGIICLEDHAGLEMAHVAQDLQQIVRGPKDIRSDDCENYFLIIQEEGRALMSQNSEVRMLSPGDMILIDSARPSEFTFFGEFNRQLSLHLPRIEMWDRFGDRIDGGLFLPRTDATAIAISAVVGKAFSASANEMQCGFLREAMFGLIGAMLHNRQDSASVSGLNADISGAELLKRGMAYIDNRFGDPELTIGSISDDLGISIRQLQRGFAMVGTTPTTYLMQKRLERACAMLVSRNSGNSDILVSTIAMDCGFSDISYFNRVFRRTFGCAPGKYVGYPQQ